MITNNVDIYKHYINISIFVNCPLRYGIISVMSFTITMQIDRKLCLTVGPYCKFNYTNLILGNYIIFISIV